MTDLMTVGMRYLPGKYLAGTGLQVRMVLEMNGMSQLVTSNDFGEDLPCIALRITCIGMLPRYTCACVAQSFSGPLNVSSKIVRPRPAVGPARHVASVFFLCRPHTLDIS